MYGGGISKIRVNGEDCLTGSFISCFTKYYQGDQIKEYEMDGHVALMGEMTNAHNTSVGKPERKRPLGRSRRG